MAPSVKHLGNNSTLKILCAVEQEKILGIAPLRKTRRQILGTNFGYEAIEPLTYRHSDYTGIITTKRKSECIKLFLNHLYSQKDWDIMYLNDIPDSSSALKQLLNVHTQIPDFTIKKGMKCFYIKIPKSTEELWNGLSANFRASLRKSMRRLQRDIGDIDLVEYEKIMNLEQAMKLFFDMHQKRLNYLGKAGAFKTQIFRDIYMDLAKLMDEKNWLRLYFLTVNNKPVSTAFTYEYGSRIFGQLVGFYPEFSKYGVGNITIFKLLEECISKRIKELDFLQGDDKYKSKWTKNYRNTVDITFVNKKKSSKIINFALNNVNNFPFINKILDRAVQMQ